MGNHNYTNIPSSTEMETINKIPNIYDDVKKDLIRLYRLDSDLYLSTVKAIERHNDLNHEFKINLIEISTFNNDDRAYQKVTEFINKDDISISNNIESAVLIEIPTITENDSVFVYKYAKLVVVNGCVKQTEELENYYTVA